MIFRFSFRNAKGKAAPTPTPTPTTTGLLLVTAALSIQFGSTVQVFAQIPSHPTHTQPPNSDRGEIPPPPWAKDLNLTLEQKSKLKAINERAHENGRLLHQQLMSSEQKMKSLWQSKASIDQLRQQHQQIQQLRQQIDEDRFESLLSERQVLTPEQLARTIEKFTRQPIDRL